MSVTVVEIEVPVGSAALLPVVGPGSVIEVLVPGVPGPPAQEINLLYDSGTSSYPARPSVASVTWIGPVDPNTLAHDGDLWINTA